MTANRERILLVESDPKISDLIARQTLSTLGYQILVTRTVAEALREATRYAPDIIITNLRLPDLSGKDLIVAINSQGLEIPVIATAVKGMEADLISAMRLGAADYLVIPAREGEIVSAVERVCKQIQSRREKETLAVQLKHSNDQLQQRVRELTAIITIGKAVTSITRQKELLEKIVEGAIYVSSADAGWFLLRQDQARIFHLVAQKHLPAPVADKLDKPWDDGISSLVAISGEPLSIHGEPLSKFKLSQLGKAALVVPVKVKREVIGILVVIRKKPMPFTPANSTLVEAVADYASISIVNARLFRTLEDRAKTLQYEIHQAHNTQERKELFISSIQHKVEQPIHRSIHSLDALLADEQSPLTKKQKAIIQRILEDLSAISESIDLPYPEVENIINK